ncbi:helix-turn-helix domain-containing protein [Actinacidiphila yeochonensis]|uniref:helix-turn-helix domain-containing protein n=1 Tax=Actinacidiphila yeochonensis TaxID=89050 RepID=UPI0006921D45|nr:helix-turn-helix transcriptional regulator [Actinacidiphila yeochonensis]
MNTAKDHCPQCGREVVQPKRGRNRLYCGDICQLAARRQRRRAARTAGPPTGSDRRPIAPVLAEEIHQTASRLLDAQHGGRDLESAMELADRLVRAVEDFQLAAVHDARAAGAPWREVAAAAKVSTAAAQSRWKPDRVKRRLELRAGRPATAEPVAAAHGRGTLDTAAARGAAPAQDEQVSRAAAKLAAALSFLHRRSGLTVQAAAEKADVSPSYLSRIFTGERLPSWQVVETLAEVFAADPRDVRVLWEAANCMTPTARSTVEAAAERLRGALRGLHLAAGGPSYEELARAGGTGLPLESVNDLLAGDGVPWWPATSRLVAVLGGVPGDIKPLWQAVHYSFLASCGAFPTLGEGDPDAARSVLDPPVP